jgi:uncharacterized protein YegJ (DUF2314 family)
VLTSEIEVAMRQISYSVLCTFALFSAALTGCDKKDRKVGDVVERPGEPDIISVDENDPRMNAAIDKARSTVGQFIKALGNPQSFQSGFSVKAPIRDGEHIEHMWLAPVHYRDGKFVGTVNNEPDVVKTVKLGEQYELKTGDISDWMYVENGKLVGGFTIRVLRDAAPKEKRAEFDRSVPFKIE